MGSEVLSDKWSGCMIFIYLVTSVVTFIMAAGSLGLEKQVYNLDCNLVSDFCSSFTYALPAIAVTFSIITLALALAQAYLYHTQAITGIVSFISNVIAGILWLIVLVIGWVPINVSYDSFSGNYSIAITGWFVAVKQVYTEYNSVSGFSFDRQGTDTINFCFGLLVITCIIYALSIIMAIIGLIVHMQDISSAKQIGSDTAPTTGNTNKGQWVRPDTAQKPKESVSSV